MSFRAIFPRILQAMEISATFWEKQGACRCSMHYSSGFQLANCPPRIAPPMRMIHSSQIVKAIRRKHHSSAHFAQPESSQDFHRPRPGTRHAHQAFFLDGRPPLLSGCGNIFSRLSASGGSGGVSEPPCSRSWRENSRTAASSNVLRVRLKCPAVLSSSSSSSRGQRNVTILVLIRKKINGGDGGGRSCIRPAHGGGGSHSRHLHIHSRARSPVHSRHPQSPAAAAHRPQGGTAAPASPPDQE